MSSVTKFQDTLVSPIFNTSKKFYILLAVLIAGVAWFAFAYVYQLSSGLAVTGLRDMPGGVPWGLYMTNFVFFIGITHAGIAIASAIRLFKLKNYTAIARMAELVTVFSLMMAGLSVVMDLGRPDRLFGIITNYGSRIGSSPLVWDITAVGVYLVFAVTYLYVEMREDLVKLADKVKWGWLYRLLLVGHREGEREKIERIVFWASIFNFPIMVMVHTTVGWIFGLLVSRPGWYGAILGPYYVAGAILSGIATVVVVSWIFRSVFKWQNVIKPMVFRGLGRVLSWFSILYIYFMLAELVTVKFAGPSGELVVSAAWSSGEFALAYWVQVAALILAFIIFFVNTVFPKLFTIGSTVFASAVVAITLWVTRFLIVVPSLTRPFLPYEVGSYSPTWVEWSIIGGTFFVVALMFTLFSKFLPILPITEINEAEKEAT
jgi:molybdopterin-containing oxidoreductase family membrane subunit